MKNDRRLEIRCSQEFLERLDRVRGVVPRGTFVKSLLSREIAKLPELPSESEVRARDVVPSPEAIEHVRERPAPGVSSSHGPSLRDTWAR